MRLHRLRLLLVALCFFFSAASRAEEPCPSLSISPVIPGTNLFTAQQEVYLGDAIAGSVLQSAQVTQDPALVGPLQTILTRLAGQVPPADRVPFRVSVVDSATADAFSIPGRIYVSRKLIALTRSEDEMAGVLAHEMGHMLAHHSAIAMSEQFRVVLNVTEVGDSSDISDKWNQYLSNYRRQPVSRGDVSKAHKLEEREQAQADNIALYLMSRAGYSTQAFVDFFDRLAETKGNTGNFWSGLFGNTKPDSKRLREIIRNRPTMPEECIDHAKKTVPNYAAWRRSVLAYTATHQESLPGLISKRSFIERLRPELDYVRISPDGRYALAQDDSNIFVLTRSPLKSLFRIDAADASAAQFSPDSRSIVFQIAPIDSSPRVERWDIGSQKRTDIHEIYVKERCLATALSPDGSVLGCLTFLAAESRFDYDLFDTVSGNSFWHKKGWLDLLAVNNAFSFSALNEMSFSLRHESASAFLSQITRARFSPDGHYFLAHSPSNTLAMNMINRSEISVGGGVRDLLNGDFTFLANDQLVGYSTFKEKTAVVHFPDGTPIYKDLPIGNLHFSKVARGNYVLLHPLKDNQVGVFDLEQRTIRVMTRHNAIDVWQDQFISEGSSGDVVTFDLSTVKPVEKTELPDAPLGPVFAAAVSPDLNWLALSEKSRGAVWDVRTGKRIYHLRGFRGGYFPDNTQFFTVFPKLLQTERSVVMLKLDGATIQTQRTIPEDEQSFEIGPYILLDKRGQQGYDMDLRELATGRSLWSKHFSNGGFVWTADSHSKTVVFQWTLGSRQLQDLTKQDPGAPAKLAAFHDRSGIDYLQVVKLNSGKTQGGFAFDTGKYSIRIKDTTASGNDVAIADTNNRVLVYSMDGKQRSVITGTSPRISPQSHRLMVRPKRNAIAVYDLDSLQRRQLFEFPTPISTSAFSGDGQRLLVFTADQTLYTFDLSATTAVNAAAK